jgi:hypothetical protein
MINPQSTIVVVQRQVSTKVSDETIILNLSNGTYYGLNELGSLIWSQIQSPQTIETICQAIRRQYDVELNQCQRDVIALIESLLAQGLVDIT